ncbi:BadF/BadG/BcrA/BcrD ATPase family protein [Aestuariispira insulae]|uniref:Glucosamine kinase n=1 Tax=Aestuariispira insulae TaxID=1461337 RepID=A0A3D9HQ01_9PROT|nr:BadF/BadG/BcrA/BcrD ATPase family protein [Aestuariispira insulae]RED51594.1 glucosamine kinase [Aestuariispira insulae]
MTVEMFLGIDGGGTNCRARLVDADGTVLGEGRAGPSNTTLGIDQAFGEILKAAYAACDQAGLDKSTFSHTHAGFGLAGLPDGRDRNRLLNYPHPFASLAVNTDAHTACLGAHGGRNGGIVIFGTGSCGYAILEGRGHNVGGWGFRLSDHASGAWVGKRAVQAALQSFDGILPPSTLAEDIMAEFANSAEQAVIWAETARPVDYGAIAPKVVSRAESGDALARNLMLQAAEEATHLIQAVAAKGVAQIACLGGFFKYLSPWLPDKINHLLVTAKGDPLDGAIRMARNAQAEGNTNV